MRKTYIDLSYANGAVNFEQLKTNALKIDAAYIKLDEGIGDKFIDFQAKNNIAGCQRIGLPFGLYHFCTLNVPNDIKGDATREADSVLAHMHTLGVTPSIIPAFDIETNTGNLTPDQVVTWMNTFFSEIKNNGIPDFRLYGGLNGNDNNKGIGLNKLLPKNHPFGNIKLWIAEYPAQWSPEKKPVLPNGWSKYDMWQYSGTATVSGIKNHVDLSVTFE